MIIQLCGDQTLETIKLITALGGDANGLGWDGSSARLVGAKIALVEDDDLRRGIPSAGEHLLLEGAADGLDLQSRHRA